MVYAGIQMLMEKLNQLINLDDIPFIINNPEIVSERPQFQLLYDELASMVQTLVFIDQHQDIRDLEKLKRRFTEAAEEAEYIVDLFLTRVHITNNRHLLWDFKRFWEPLKDFFRGFLISFVLLFISPFLALVCFCSQILSSFRIFLSRFNARNSLYFLTNGGNKSLNLDDVWRSFKSLKVELASIKMETTLIQSAPAPISISTNSQKLLDEIVVGLDADVELIRDKLVEDHKKLDVVSVVGMGGIGKTTLATKVFNDPFVVYHFHVRVWVTVSQTYDKRSVLVQILESIRAQLGLENAGDSRLCGMVHKSLMGRRYLIVIDDIWDIGAWDNLKLFFPHDNTGSRILLTSRFTEIAKHVKSDGLIHHMGYINKERSWELLCQKVFHGNESPIWSIKPGMQIVENCKGLPLAVAVIAGILAKEAWSKKFWVEIAYKTGSYIASEGNGCLETLDLSYNHLPLYLRECFLYLGGFPEDYEIQVKWLTRLWVAEGFIEEDGNRSLEDIAEGYLMDLIDRNLVIVAKRKKSNGDVKACKMHDLIRQLCLKKAREERFFLQIDRLIFSSNVIKPPYKPIRKFIDTKDPCLSYPSTQNLRSLFFVRRFIYMRDDITTYFRSFVLLRVLDLQNVKLTSVDNIELLVHLRYLAISIYSKDFPSSICKLWNLQTLIYGFAPPLFGESSKLHIVLPSNISDLVNLRHLKSLVRSFEIGFIEKPMNLRTISGVWLNDKAFSFQKYFPCIKELSCLTKSNKHIDFKPLTYLERLKVRSYPLHGENQITLPATLKSLTIDGCCFLPWSDMSIIQSLPNLQVLKLENHAFSGSCWNTDGQEFPQLKFLRLDTLDIKQWEVYIPSFPCLKQLEINRCCYLEETPLEIGDIPTLELIKISECRYSVGDSVRRIQEEQQDMGNYNLKIEVLNPY